MHYLRLWNRGGVDALPVIQKPTVEERFWAKVDKSGECWVWTAGITGSDGYGGFWFKGRWIPASRVSWELTYGPIPEGMHVLHRCDNPPCVRPDHFFLGTQAQNNADRDQKGRHVALRGEQNGFHKLTEEKVREILRLCAAGVRTIDVATRFDVATETVRKIALRKAWRHVSLDR